MEWGSTEVARPHLNPATVAALVSPKSNSPFITRKTATITVKVGSACPQEKTGNSPYNAPDESSYDTPPSQDTVTSNSSTAALLKETARDIRHGHIGSLIEEEDVGVPQVASSSCTNINYIDEQGAVATGKALLAKTLKEVKRSLQDLSPVIISRESLAEAIKKDPVAQKKKTYVKNLVVMSISCTLMWSTFCSLRSIQSSLNHQDGLGLISMSSLNIFFVFGCICAVTCVQRIRPKFAMLFSMIGQLLYIFSNFYPSFYTLIPATAILGFCFAVFWTAQCVYLTSIGFMYATLAGKTADSILALFNGFFFVLIQLGQIFGHLISSSVFSMGNQEEISKTPYLEDVANLTANFSFSVTDHDKMKCGINYCHSYKIEHQTLNLKQYLVFILLSTFVAMTFLAMLVNGVWLDKLDIIFHRTKGGLSRQMAAVFHLHGDVKQLLFLWFTLYLGFEEAFIYGEITKAFITCPLGVHMVGYVMMCFGACDATTSVISARLVKYVGRIPMVICGTLTHGIILATMFLWSPTSHDTVYLFLLIGAWGVGDAFFQTQAPSLCGMLFPKQQEAAFAAYRLYEALGNMVAFGYAQFLCLQIKLYITGSALAVAVIAYAGLEFYLKKHNKVDSGKQKKSETL